MNRSSWCALALALAFVSAGTAHAADPLNAVLERFAPVFVQVAHGKADYVTRFDYDGDWNGANNWDHLDAGHPLPAVIYASAIESARHYFLTYSAFHPRDYWPVSVPDVNHENDLEGVLLVVEKREGQLVPLLMESVAHQHLLRYSSDPALAHEHLNGKLFFEGEHPLVHVAAYKHPQSAMGSAELWKVDGIVYRFHARSDVPKGLHDRDCGYALISLLDSFWPRRFDVGHDRTFGSTDTFAPGTFGAGLNGHKYAANRAHAPWAWRDSDDEGLAHGDWFFDPAHAMRFHYPGIKERFVSDYRVNPYLEGR